MSASFTVRLPRKLMEKMKKYREVNWSEVVRRAIESYIKRLEESRNRESSSELLERLQDLGVKVNELQPKPIEEEIKLHRKMREIEWKRLNSMIQVQ